LKTLSARENDDFGGLKTSFSGSLEPAAFGRIEVTPPALIPMLAPSSLAEHQESQMIPETQVHVIARQMIAKHGFEAIAQAAQHAIACEKKGDAEEAQEWRHIEAAMKLMRGPNQS